MTLLIKVTTSQANFWKVSGITGINQSMLCLNAAAWNKEEGPNGRQIEIN